MVQERFQGMTLLVERKRIKMTCLKKMRPGTKTKTGNFPTVPFYVPLGKDFTGDGTRIVIDRDMGFVPFTKWERI